MSAYAQPGSMAWSIPQYSAVMATQSMLAPGLKFFIERDNGSLVPLVPVDELPDDVRLAGVPHRLSASQTKDMLFLGRHSSVRGRFPHEGSVNVKESVPPPSVTMQYTPQSGVSSHNSRVLQVSCRVSSESIVFLTQFSQPINTQPIVPPELHRPPNHSLHLSCNRGLSTMSARFLPPVSSPIREKKSTALTGSRTKVSVPTSSKVACTDTRCLKTRRHSTRLA